MDAPPPYTPLPDPADPYGQLTATAAAASPPRPPLAARSLLTPTPTPSQDPRSASQTSLVPAAGDDDRRTLLVIYIHGFMGNETSFQSFPTHVHNLLCVLLDPLGYRVHTKVYPKFKTRHNILVATENFSQWLSQFESPTTDIVLLGHSMGGLLSADISLLRTHSSHPRHRILGTISFDTPFLGMHPGVISSGLSSLFRPAPKSPSLPDSLSTDTLHTVSSASSSTHTQVDTFYSRRPERNFTVAIPKKEGTWDSTWRFINKYHDRLTSATGQYLLEHFEFGGCLADPVGLKKRYVEIRAAEDSGGDRVRFVNYYTASTGRGKEAVAPAPAPAVTEGLGLEGAHSGLGMGLGGAEVYERPTSAASYDTMISDDAEMQQLPPEAMSDEEYPVALHIIETDEPPVVDGHAPGVFSDEKTPFVEEEDGEMSREVTVESLSLVDSEPLSPVLPPLPPPPTEPERFDYTLIPDAAVRKAAEKEVAKTWKRYEKALKDHEKLIRDREKALEKIERKRGKEREKGVRCKEKEREKGMRCQEKEILREVKEREKAEKDKVKELERREKEREKAACKGKEKEKVQSSHEKQELERLRKEQDRMDAEHRRMNGLPSPTPAPPPQYLASPHHPAPPSSASASSASASPSHTHLPPSSASTSHPHPTSPKPCKKKRERRFCILPSDKDDKCWVKVSMSGVDEVGAHCGLFFVGEVYERLVGDVAARVEEWVGEASSRRVARERAGAEEGGGKEEREREW